MKSLVAGAAQRNQLEKEFVAGMSVGVMVHVVGGFGAAPFANALGAQEDELAPQLPFVAGQVGAVAAEPLPICGLFCLVALLGVTLVSLPDEIFLEGVVPVAQRVHLRCGERGMFDRAALLIATGETLVSETDGAVAGGLAAQFGCRMRARRVRLVLLVDGLQVGSDFGETHKSIAAARSWVQRSARAGMLHPAFRRGGRRAAADG